MNIRLPPGTYTITSTYNGLNVANTVKVNQQKYVPSSSKDTGGSSSIYEYDTHLCPDYTFDSNANVEVKIYTGNSYKTFYGKTNSFGHLSIPIKATVNEVHKIEIIVLDIKYL